MLKLQTIVGGTRSWTFSWSGGTSGIQSSFFCAFGQNVVIEFGHFVGAGGRAECSCHFLAIVEFDVVLSEYLDFTILLERRDERNTVVKFVQRWWS